MKGKHPWFGERAGPRLTGTLVTALGVALLISTSCKPRHNGAAATSGPRVEDMSWGPIQLTLTAQPSVVELEKDVLLTIRVVAPSEMDVTVPSLADRLEGFSLSGAFADEPVTRDGKTTRVTNARLTPFLAKRYRLAPLAIQCEDRATSPPRSAWFPTRPLVFEYRPPLAGGAGKTIAGKVDPVWIYPPFKTVALYCALAAALLGLGFLAWKLLRRVKENIELRRMSPKERALRELAQLLSKDLTARQRVKEFYLELTMIVRRYIERQHSIRAPEQTTEEFLAAVAQDPRFTAEVIRRLKAFLESADLVKFAAYRPPDGAVAQATDTARQYIETDSAAADAAGQSAKAGAAEHGEAAPGRDRV